MAKSKLRPSFSRKVQTADYVDEVLSTKIYEFKIKSQEKVFVRSLKIRLEAAGESCEPLMLWHIDRPIGRRIPINKGYSKEITIIYTVRAKAAIACRSVPTYRVLHVCMHMCSQCHVIRPFSFQAKHAWRFSVKNQSSANTTRISARIRCSYNFNFLSMPLRTID